jgi:hypothetical protein
VRNENFSIQQTAEGVSVKLTRTPYAIPKLPIPAKFSATLISETSLPSKRPLKNTSI